MRFRVFALIAYWSGRVRAYRHRMSRAPGGQRADSRQSNRIVLGITRAADGRLDGQLIAIDQGAQPRTMSAISSTGVS